MEDNLDYGLASYSPVTGTYKLPRDNILTPEQQKALSFIADFIPVVGDIKGFAEAENRGDYFFAMAAIIPLYGDAAKKAHDAKNAYEKAKDAQDVAGMAKAVNDAKREIPKITVSKEK